MPRIRQLSPSVINKIAAGEVIERPSSVVKELLENALDAGSTRIDVTVEQGGMELIRIVDNGCGMTPEVAARIWEPFFTTKGEAGNGLGLDIAKAVIDTHGGTIVCQSSPGQGATFTIRLPIAGVIPPNVVPPLVNAPTLPIPTQTPH